MDIKIEVGESSANRAAKPFPGLTAEQGAQIERESKTEWNRNASEREAFGNDFSAFLNYRKAAHAGLVRIHGGKKNV